MEAFEAIYNRRAVKHFDPEHKLTDTEIDKLMQAAIQSPTSFNIQHWRFVIIDDPELRKQIRAAGNDHAQMTEASLLILMTADVKAWAKDPSRYWRNAPADVAKILVDWMGPFHEGKDQLQRDEAMRSIGIAMQTIMIATTSMGYQSCPMIGFDHEKVAQLVQLPTDHVIGPMIVIGRGIKDPWPKPGQLELSDVVIKNRF